MEIHQKIFVAQLSEVAENGEKEHGSETSITSVWRQKWENWDMGRGYASQEIKWYWLDNKEFAINGKQKDSAPEETSVVSSTTVMNVQDQH